MDSNHHLKFRKLLFYPLNYEGKSSYNIIKGYKSGVTAGFWQGIAKMFGSDLKAPYDPEGEDEMTEELVKLWEAGEFEGLYYSLFWQWPPTVDIPSKYL